MNRLKVASVACVIGLASYQAAVAEAVISGEFGLSFGPSVTHSTDDSDNRVGSFAFALDGSVSARFNGWVGTFDASTTRRGLKGEYFRDVAPSAVNSAGLHFGREFGANYVGAFVGMNWFQGGTGGSNSANRGGTLYGVEASVAVTDSFTAYGHIGRADMIGDSDDTQFVGPFIRLGVADQITDKVSVAAEVEAGSSPHDFEDGGNSGEYMVLTLSGDYEFKPQLIGTISISSMRIRANTEDTGQDSQINFGLRIPFGETQNNRGNLATSYRPGLAAAWAETLD